MSKIDGIRTNNIHMYSWQLNYVGVRDGNLHSVENPHITSDSPGIELQPFLGIHGGDGGHSF